MMIEDDDNDDGYDDDDEDNKNNNDDDVDDVDDVDGYDKYSMRSSLHFVLSSFHYYDVNIGSIQKTITDDLQHR